MWSVAKAYFNKRMIARPMQELNRQQLHEYVEEAFRAIDQEVISRLTHANRSYIQSVLKQYADREERD